MNAEKRGDTRVYENQAYLRVSAKIRGKCT